MFQNVVTVIQPKCFTVIITGANPSMKDQYVIINIAIIIRTIIIIILNLLLLFCFSKRIEILCKK